MSHKITPLSRCAAMNMVWLLCLLSLLLLSSADSVELLALHDPTMALNHVAVRVETQHLDSVSSSVLMAESWLRYHVLSHYPSTNITTILVGHSLLCNHHYLATLILPSINNIHYSLTRWGLQNHIKVAVSFSSDCLASSISEKYFKPLLTILQQMGSPIVLSDESLKSHFENLGVSLMNTTIMILINSRNEKPLKRKLSFIDISRSKLPFPPKPTPVVSPSPSHSSNPAYAVGTPLPPLVGTVTPPPSVSPALPPAANLKSPPFRPHLAPMASPPHLPPCEPSHAGAPVVGGHHGLWCVAKPSVPAETLQEALDYACGEGSADCEAIQNEGSCRYPDTVVAHASYAFNSYWQRTKKNGGTCGFGGTAMLINSDPSYGHCRFIIS
ncbi:hypothetical protein ACS0TY_029955 [Phlomoides rotata]